MADLHLNILDSLRVASPCPARWEDMAGDDRSRHCAQCNLCVHNISDMTRDEADAFLRSRLESPDPPARLCIQFFRRADGTILTRDCPRGLAAARARMVRLCGRFAAAIALLFTGSIAAAASSDPTWARWGWALKLRHAAAVQWVRGKLNPPSPFSIRGEAILGKVSFGSIPIPPDKDGSRVGPHMHDQ